MAAAQVKVTPIKEKMLVKIQQDINRKALIKLLDLEASVIMRSHNESSNR